jgi:hypothetical protein
MASNHTATLKLAQIEATRKGWRLLVNTIYRGWTGELVREWKTPRGIAVELRRAAFRVFGLGTGTLDLVGWRPVRITADMVGQTIAQYVEVDAKTQGYKRMSAEQKNRARCVREAGGFAGIAMKVDVPGEARIAIAEIGEDL